MGLSRDRWSEGVGHHNSSIRLVKLINALDDDLALDLKTGGDGDIGETLAYFLDDLIDRGIINIQIRDNDLEG